MGSALARPQVSAVAPTEGGTLNRPAPSISVPGDLKKMLNALEDVPSGVPSVVMAEKFSEPARTGSEKDNVSCPELTSICVNSLNVGATESRV